MKSELILNTILNKYKKNDLIFVSQLYKEEYLNVISEYSYYKIIERLNKKQKITKVSKGIYTITNVCEYGIIPIFTDDIINKYICNQGGVVIGYTLYNRLGITTQISKSISIYSSKIDNNIKKIKDVFIKKVNLIFSDDVKKMIEFLEILQNFKNIEDINYNQFINYTEKIVYEYTDETLELVLDQIKYKKSTLSFLHNILNFYNVDNNISKYLSSLSDYKHLEMRDIYEITRGKRRI